MKLLYFLFFCGIVFSQSKPVAIEINSLMVTEKPKEKSFKLTYTVSNLTDKTIHFFLNPDALVPIGAGSLNPGVYYKVYENDSSIDVSGIFTRPGSSRSFKDEKTMQKYFDSIAELVKNKSLEMIEKEKKQRISNHLQEFGPKETRQFEAILNWDKTRYYRNDVIEYYINETAPHYFELHINLMKDELLSDFSPEEKEQLLKNKNLIRGWFTSPKVEIDFKE